MSFVHITFYRPLSIQITVLTLFYKKSINLKDLSKSHFIDPCQSKCTSGQLLSSAE